MKRPSLLMQGVFVFFLVSGFCSVLYELVWLRLSMAEFGVTTALVSIVLSTFMAGLGLGSWGSGYLIRKFEKRFVWPALRLYAATEFLIGISALLVPRELFWGRTLLEHWDLSSSWSYYLGSGIWVALSLIPWCACMGATIPIAMLCIRRAYADESPRSFSYLYLANVLGAVGGSIIPLLFIELYGFRGTLRIGAALNFLLTVSALALSNRQPESSEIADSASAPIAAIPPGQTIKPLLVLFLSGLTSMGMEVVWIRLFTPYLGTVVYAFAEILCAYLIATFLGSRLYRQWSVKQNPKPIWMWIWALLGLSALLPLVTAATGFPANAGQRVWLGLILFSSILGFVTPMLVDRWSAGNPDRAGQAYAINVLGCILGPLLSGFFLLPWVGERWALVILSTPWFILGFYPLWLTGKEDTTPRRIGMRQAIAAAALVLGVVIAISSKDYGTQFLHHEILRDNTATVVATGEGMQRRLLVNGVGITHLTPVTKMIAHLPLASLTHPPRNALVICFGMGTTYRSALSWDIPATVVELVPSVPRLFGYYHPDGPDLLRSPLSHVVIDDGRRYLERTNQKFDVITLDPPPPVQAAASSLLYSRELYSLVRLHLRPGGILQTWLPNDDSDPAVRSSVAQALKISFPYVRAFGSLDYPGYHFLASDQPIPDWTPQQLVSHMPPKAIADMMEWGPESTPEQQFAVLLKTEFPIDHLIAEDPSAPPLQDDRPVNEYFFLRRYVPRLAGHIQAASVSAY